VLICLFFFFSVSFAEFQIFQTVSSKVVLPAVNQTVEWSGEIPRPHGKVLITGMTFDVVDDNGVSIHNTEAYIHHIVVYSDPANLITCSHYDGWLGATGNASTPLLLPLPYGIFDGSSSRWGMDLMVVSLSNKGTRFYASVHVNYSTDQSDFDNFISVIPLYFAVTQCKSPTYNLTAGGEGSRAVNSSLMPMPFNGKIVFGIPHMHNGGVQLILTDTTTGLEICNESPVYNNGNPSTGNQTTIGICKNDNMMWRGDMINVTAVYDTSITRINVMSIYLIYVSV
jgi:hypothetical protein